MSLVFFSLHGGKHCAVGVQTTSDRSVSAIVSHAE